MKLTKAQLKEQQQLSELLKKENLTEDEIEKLFKDFNPGTISDVTIHSAYFTPLDLAYDFALMVPTHGVCVDMCAGIGVLTHAAHIRDSYEGKIKRQICIERNKDYLEIGKKLCPYAKWINGDMFDKGIWDEIKKEYGEIDCIISNPPFGKVSQTDAKKDWLKYTGKDIDIASIEIAMLNAEYCSFILPPSSCTFRYSGRPYYQEYDNKKIAKLKRETGMDFYMCCASVDASVYEDFKNTKVNVECLTIDRDV